MDNLKNYMEYVAHLKSRKYKSTLGGGGGILWRLRYRPHSLLILYFLLIRTL